MKLKKEVKMQKISIDIEEDILLDLDIICKNNVSDRSKEFRKFAHKVVEKQTLDVFK